MAQVLIVDNDTSIREAVRDILEDAGYTVRDSGGLPDIADAMVALLRVAPEPMVTLFDVGPFDVERVQYMLDVASISDASLQRHVYICLTTMPNLLPAQLRALFEAQGIAVLPKPFDMDELLRHVVEAEKRLKPGA